MRSNNIYIGVGVMALLLLLLYFLSKKGYQWDEHYKSKSEDPYGTKIMLQLLKSTDKEVFTLKDSLSKTLPLDIVTSSNYIFIGQSLNLAEADVSELIQYVSRGNQAFLFCKYIPTFLMDSLYLGECNDSEWDGFEKIVSTSVSLNLNHTTLHAKDSIGYVFLNRFGKTQYQWSYFHEDYFCENEGAFAALGSINDSLVNFARVQYGSGYFYLHTTPIVFTNLNLLEPETFNYANNVFSHLNNGDIYWDEYSRIKERLARSRDRNRLSSGLSEKGPFQYILSQPPLYWAWYLLLAMGVLFLIFRAKRRERIIPVLAQNRNTSLDFVRTIGRLYFLQNNHQQLALQKMKLFHIDIKERYGLHFNENDATFEENLSVRSDVDVKVIQKIYLMYRNINNSKFYVSANTLVDFSKEIDAFYDSSLSQK